MIQIPFNVYLSPKADDLKKELAWSHVAAKEEEMSPDGGPTILEDKK